jgi:hypothetical protein
MRFPRFVPVLFCITLNTFSLFAQSPNGNINGLVSDPSSAAVVGAEVVAVNDVTGVQNTTKTNNEGIYVLPNLPPGPYRVQVSKVGFKTLIKPDITLNVQDSLSINFTLLVGAFHEVVTVQGGTTLVNTESAAVSTVIDQKFVENIPLNGRSFQDLISMTPGVVTQGPNSSPSGVGSGGDFSVNGQRTESNYYTVDGVAANLAVGDGSGNLVQNAAASGSVPASTVLGTTQSLISVDALLEFRVQTSTYSAEYGRSPGGQFSFVTRSGTKEMHGTAFEYLRNGFFDANDWFNDHYGVRQPGLKQNDFGGTLGGPVVIPGLYNGKERTFFFLSYEGLRLTQPEAAMIEYVPDSFMRQQAVTPLQPILDAFPLENGTDYGTSASPSLAQFIEGYALPSRIDATSIRLDHTFAQKLSVFFRCADAPSSNSTRNLSSLSNNSVNTQTYTLGATSQFSGSLFNEFHLGYARVNAYQHGVIDDFGGAVPINLAAAMGSGQFAAPGSTIDIYLAGIGLADLSVGHGTNNRGRQWNLTDALSVIRGRHQIKIGADYRRVASPTVPASPLLSAVYFDVPSVLDNSAFVLGASQSLDAAPIFNEMAAFVEDEWRVTSRLNLSLGIRWDVDPPPHGSNGNDAYTLLGNIGNPNSLALAPRGTALWKTSWYNFAPRFGFAWSVRNRSGWETVIRAGGGAFFDTNNQVAAQGFQEIGFSAVAQYYSAPLPATAAQLDFTPSASAPYTSSPIDAFPAHLQMPYTLQYNLSLQQAINKEQALTMSYVGATGRRLTAEQELYLGALNPNFGTVYYFLTNVTSGYNALQMKFQRSVRQGVQTIASYTWSHCLDFGSNYFTLPVTRGNCDFDVRHNLQAGVSWDLPSIGGNKIAQALVDHWGLDGRVMARTGFPVTLYGNFIADPATGRQYYGNLDIVPGQPVYVYGSQYPGNRAINSAAFAYPPDNDPGDAPRNFVRGFGESQINLAIRREFPLHDRLRLQFRAEAFNIFNHPNFGYIDPYLGDTTFGQALSSLNQSLSTVASQYQQGGPRSMQFALKLSF